MQHAIIQGGTRPHSPHAALGGHPVMNALALSRLQFGFTIGYHILWPTFTIGIASFVALLSFLWWRTGRPIYGALIRFWFRIFALGFGMGVVTGIVLSYEIGTNWSGFSR